MQVHNYYRRLFILSVLLILTTYYSSGQTEDSLNSFHTILSEHLADSIPLNPNVRYGKLGNGLTYYIEKYRESDSSIHIYLPMKVGNFQEDIDQLEFAHLLEHMAFRKTESIDNVTRQLAEKGFRLGRDFNGRTGYSNTIYEIHLSSKSNELLEDGLMPLKEWAQGIILEPSQIDIEKNVVTAEKRRSYEVKGFAIAKKRNEALCKLMGDSRFTERILADTRGNLKELNYQSLSRFYHDWYRPDLQAVVVVGDVNVEKVEQHIKNLFSDLTNPSKPREYEEFTPNMSEANDFVAVSGKELEDITIEVFFWQRFKKPVFYLDFKKILIQELFNKMMLSRFHYREYQLTNASCEFKSQLPLVGAKVSGLHCELRIDTLSSIEKEFKELFVELYRVKRYGFVDEEVIQAKNELRKELLGIYSTTNYSGKTRANKYVHHFLDGEFAPSPEHMTEIIDTFIPTISLSDINSMVEQWITDSNRDIIMLYPSTKAISIPDKAMIEKWFEDIKSQRISAPLQQGNPRKIEQLHDFPKIAKREGYEEIKYPGIGVTKIALKNGIQITLKPFHATGFRSNDILFYGFKTGGAACYSEFDSLVALNAADIIAFNSVGNIDPSELREALMGDRARLHPFISKDRSGFSGSSDINGLEKLFQLTYLYFTDPTINGKSLEDWKMDYKRKLDNGFGPQDKFQNAIDAALGHNIKREQYLTIEELDKVQFEDVLKIFKEQFDNGNGFKFVITGDFDPALATEYILRYFSPLPGRNSSKNLTVSREFKQLKVEEIPITIIKSERDRGEALVRLVFLGKNKYDDENMLKRKVLSSLLQMVLLNRLRNEEGLVYNLGANEDENGRIFVSFSCDPKKVEYAIKSSLQEILKLNETPDPNILQRAIRLERQSINSDLKNNSFWYQYLLKTTRERTDPNELLYYEYILDQLTPDDLSDIITHYLQDNNFKCFVLMPRNYLEIN